MLRLAAFSASTLVGTAVDTAVLWVCAHFWLHGYAGERLLAPTISFVCATMANYAVAYFFVWPDRIHYRTLRSFTTHYFAYLGSCIGGFVIKMLFLQLFTLLLTWDVVWCNLLALCFSGLFNFFMNDRIVFRRKNNSAPDEPTPTNDSTTDEPTPINDSTTDK